MFTENYKNIKNVVNEIFKLTISGKSDTEEAPIIEGYKNTNIQEKYNITHPNSTVDYADM